MLKPAVDDRYRAPALDKGLDILELLASQPSGMTRSEIVKTLGKSPSEVYRMIERLVARQYVTRSLEGDRYALSMKLFLLASKHPPLRRLTSHAQPLLDQFSRQTLQSIHLAAPEKDIALVIAQASGPANWEFRLKVGTELDLIETGSGKTLLAFQSDEWQQDLLSRKSATGIKQSTKQNTDLKSELQQIKMAGHRISKSGQLIGITDISVPIMAKDGTAFGVLTCPFIERVKADITEQSEVTIEEIKTLLLELAENISIN